MVKNKTTETAASYTDFLNGVNDESKRKNALAMINLISENTGLPPKMWGNSIVGFGSYSYKYESGHEGSAPMVGISPRAKAIVLYLASTFTEREQLLAKLGKHKTGKGCIYIQKMEDINTSILIKMIEKSIAETKRKYPNQVK